MRRRDRVARSRREPDHVDLGFTLIELLVYIVVLGILMAGLTMIFINMWRTQAVINAQTHATTRGQLVASEIEKAMRNATGFAVTDGGSTLLVQTSLSGPQQCQAFHFNTAGGSNGQGALQMVLAGAPAPAASTGYTWQDGITGYSDTTFSSFFTNVDSAGVPVATAPAGVHYSFAATAPSAITTSGRVTFSGTAYPRNATLGGTSTCWP